MFTISDDSELQLCSRLTLNLLLETLIVGIKACWDISRVFWVLVLDSLFCETP